MDRAPSGAFVGLMGWPRKTACGSPRAPRSSPESMTKKTGASRKSRTCAASKRPRGLGFQAGSDVDRTLGSLAVGFGHSVLERVVASADDGAFLWERRTREGAPVGHRERDTRAGSLLEHSPRGRRLGSVGSFGRSRPNEAYGGINRERIHRRKDQPFSETPLR